VEGLRGVAILLVVAFHAGVPGVSGGFTGVDVFFVLSGYLITGILQEERARTGRIRLPSFFARRVRRLLPASGLVLAATVAAGVVALTPLELLPLAKTARAAALYLANFRFILWSADYFAPDIARNPLLHTWSLAAEEQFYLAWPFLVILAFRGGRPARSLAVAVGAVGVLSFAASLWLTRTLPPAAFFSSPTRAWEFAAGALARQLARPAGRRGDALGWAGLAAIVASAFVISPATPFPGVAALLPVAGTAAVLVAGADGRTEGAARALAAAPLQWTGRLSYSWYLWHWPMLVLADAVLPGLSLAGRVGLALAALALAAATYAVLERPVRASPYLRARPWLSLAMGVAITAAGVGVARVARGEASAALRRPEYAPFVAAAADVGPLPRRGCIAGVASRRVRECVFGGTARPRATVVLFGDSHAHQWFPALEAVARERRWRLVTMLKTGCPAAAVPVFRPSLLRAEGECDEWRRAALLRIAALRPDAVVAGSAGAYVRDRGRGNGPPEQAYALWRRGTRATLLALERAGVRTLVLRDSPRPGFNVPICLARAVRARARPDPAACAVPTAAAVDARLSAAETDAARGIAGVSFVDLTRQVCRGPTCPPVLDGMIVYRDDNHLTATFARSLALPLGSVLAPRVEAPRTSLPR
jgi:peptidoglycan/LPS O-acetylase OafA/YrhL